MEKSISRVVFEFEDGSKRVLEGRELTLWQVMLLHRSDYFLPGTEIMILGRLKGFGGRIEGFIPPETLEKGGWERAE